MRRWFVWESRDDGCRLQGSSRLRRLGLASIREGIRVKTGEWIFEGSSFSFA